MVSYLKFTLSAMVSLKETSHLDRGSKVNTAITIVIATVVLAFPMATGLFLMFNFQNLQNQSFKAKFETLYLKVKTN